MKRGSDLISSADSPQIFSIVLSLQIQIRMGRPQNGLACRTETMARMVILCCITDADWIDRSTRLLGVLVEGRTKIPRIHGASPRVVLRVLQRIPFLDTGLVFPPLTALSPNWGIQRMELAPRESLASQHQLTHGASTRVVPRVMPRFHSWKSPEWFSPTSHSALICRSSSSYWISSICPVLVQEGEHLDNSLPGNAVIQIMYI